MCGVFAVQGLLPASVQACMSLGKRGEVNQCTFMILVACALFCRKAYKNR